MKKALKIFVMAVFVSALFCRSSQAQQITLYSQYYLNPFYINPAYVGKDSIGEFNVLYRNQWAGITGSPETQIATINGRLNGPSNMGIGGMIYNDISGIYGRTAAYFAYSYPVKLNATNILRTGISFGVVHNRIFFDRIIALDPTESTLLDKTQGKAKLDGNFGVLWENEKLEVGVSILQLFNSRYHYSNEATEKDVSYMLLRHYYGMVKYKWNAIPGKLDLNPMVMLRSTQGLPIQWDIGVQGMIKNRAWITAMYRSGYGMAISVGGHLDSKLSLGYSYDLATNGIAQLSNGSHEVNLSLRLYGKKEKSVEEKKDEKITEELLAEIRAMRTEMDSIQTELKTNKEKNAEKEMEISKMKQQMDSVQSALALHEDEAASKLNEIEDLMVQKRADIDSNRAAIDNKLAELDRLRKEISEHADQDHEYVVREHVELNIPGWDNDKYTYYVVVGSYHEYLHAKRFQKVFLRDLGLKVQLLASDVKGKYLLYTTETLSAKDAKIEIDRINSIIDLSLAPDGGWVFKKEK